MTGAPITRASYQSKRLEFVRQLLIPENCAGLEIGACDLPTIPPHLGKCTFADFRSAEEMTKLWNLPPGTVMPVEFIVDRHSALDDQITRRFDYVIACHVIEHVPNPIGYLEEMSRLLDEGGERLLFLAVPDKRCTSDATRPSTSIEHLLSDYFDDCRYPSIEHIMEFGRHWVPEFRKVDDRSIGEYYKQAVANHRSGNADAHCHVWTDQEYFDQIRRLTLGGVLEKMDVVATQATPEGYNEFMVAFRVI